ncbi:hypothetical protein AABD37_07560 [Staphylococcus nepalensis]
MKFAESQLQTNQRGLGRTKVCRMKKIGLVVLHRFASYLLTA